MSDNKSVSDEQQELLRNTNQEFANETYEHQTDSKFNNDPSSGENIEEKLKNAPAGWDDPIDTSKLNYNWGETVKPSDPNQYYDEKGVLKVPHPTTEQLMREWDARYPKVNGIPVVGVKKNGQGDITEFKLATGQCLSYAEMLRPDLILEGIVVGENRQHELTLRSAPDGFHSNNLDQLPEYE